MGLFTKSTKPVEAPEGVCPNCWGHQGYDNKVRDLLNDKQIDVNNKNAKHAFIQQFVVEHLDGIRLKKDGNNVRTCGVCGLKG